MSLWKIAWRSIQHRSLASALTAFSMALGVALVVAVLVVHSVVDQSFRRGVQGYDLLVGPKGSPLELVLNSVYYLGKPIGTIPYSSYMDVAFGRFQRDVELAVPVCLSENYKGYRIVGTTADMFDRLEYRPGEVYEFSDGQNFSPGGFFEAVFGATAARKTGLRVGDTFKPVHGLEEAGQEHDPFTITGILAPTGTPNDRAIFINIEGFYLMHEHGHEQEHADEEHADEAHAEKETEHGAAETTAEHTDNHADDDHGHATAATAPADATDEHYAHRKVSAVLVLASDVDQTRRVALPRWISEEPNLQAVAPAEVIYNLFQGIVGNVQLVLLVLAVLIVIVAGIGILVSIYNSMSDRRHEIAIMRALGARRGTVMSIILLESILLSLGGGAVGLLLGHGLIWAMAPMIMEQMGVAISPLQFQLSELILIPGLIILATIVGYLPAVIAYRTDVAQSLSARP